jgi:hypothetical protein
MSQTIMVCALIASCAGLYWSLNHNKYPLIPEPVRFNISWNPTASPAPEPGSDPRVIAAARGMEMVRGFLSESTWPDARRWVSTKDITGSISEPAYKPEEFKALASGDSKFTPVNVTELETPGEFQIVWSIEKAGCPNRLVLTTSDSPDGTRVRWHQPPVLSPMVAGTRQPVRTQNLAAPIISPPAASPPVVPVPAAAETEAAAAALAASTAAGTPTGSSSWIAAPKVDAKSSTASTTTVR